MEDFIRVVKVHGGRPVFVDLEDDGTLLLETLQSQFGANAIGLCYILFPRGSPVCTCKKWSLFGTEDRLG